MLEIRATVAPKIAFASHQNAVPILVELALVSAHDEALEDLVVEASSDPGFLEPRTWRVDRLGPGGVAHVVDRDLKLSAALLARLDEAVVGALTLTVRRGEETLARRDFPVELLARSEWGGAASMAELLAAFVMPNDPAVDRVLKAASDVLRRAGKKDGIDGYEAKSRTRVWELASAIWSAVAALRLGYALPPASFERYGQKVRSPGAILDARLATCLDTALLFAAALEQAGLNPLVILTEGHAMAGVWLQPQEFASLVTDDSGTVRKRVDLKELVVFETTLATHSPPAGFQTAVDAGRRQIAEGADDAFVMALDLRRARMRRIRPLADPTSPSSTVDGAAVKAAVESLEEAPALPGFDVEVAPEAPTGEAGRIALWQRKLLDLTTRNKLLHTAEGAKAVRLICSDVGALEDLLAEGKRIKIVPAPDLGEGGRDEAIHRRRTGEVLLNEYARSALARNEVLAPLESKRLDAALVDLYRKAKLDIEEGGANTLFLALGFLRWRKAAEDPRTYRAPLILLPVKLERKSVASGVVMVRHDDDARFNLTLLELLRQDFRLRIPGLDGALPTDASGVDVAGIWDTVRREVRDIDQFEVVEDVALSTFSFAKYLMWKDLSDRADQLKANPVVRHLLERAQERFPGRGDFPEAGRLDEVVEPGELFTPFAADSTQLAAVVASARGCDFVLDGPPGTGKSQTIANMVAHNLALGRKVLFVAEKRTALEAVHRRLADKGLGDFCLELHSNKCTKAEVVKKLARAWDTRDALAAKEWGREADGVRRLRDRLNEVVRLLHRRQANGLTLHRAIGRVVRDWTPETPALAWPPAVVHDAAALDALRDLARRLDLNWAAVRHLPRATFGTVERREWSNAWQDAVLAAARGTRTALGEAGVARDALLAATRLPSSPASLADLEALRRLASAMVGGHGRDLRFAFAPNAAATIAGARRARATAERFRAAEEGLSVPMAREAVLRLDAPALEAEWAAAARRSWPLGSLARRGFVKRLRARTRAAGRPDPDRDLARLREMGERAADLASLAGALAGVPGFAGVDSGAALADSADSAEALRSAIAGAAGDPDALVDLRGAVARVVVDGNDLLVEGGRIATALARFEGCLARLVDDVERLDGLLDAVAAPERSLDGLAALVDALIADAPRLKAWCDWRRVGAEASERGLGPLVAALTSGATAANGSPDAFETAYARWFATRAIDAEPRLRDLVTAEHDDEVAAFRRLDDRLSALSVRYIRARICGLIPDKADVGRKDGWGVLKHEMG